MSKDILCLPCILQRPSLNTPRGPYSESCDASRQLHIHVSFLCNKFSRFEKPGPGFKTILVKPICPVWS